MSRMETMVQGQLDQIGITDKETFSDYILQLLNEETMEKEEKKEAICEFLSDMVPESDAVEQVVETLLREWEMAYQESILAQQQERLMTLALEKEKEHQVLQEGVEEHKENKATVLSKEEKRRREALLAQYGYDLDEVVEKENGEVEIIYKGSASNESIKSNAGLERNRNADIVKEQEQVKRYQAQQEHQKIVARNKELQEKQRLEKEKEKKRTQKREKRRM